MKKSFLMVFICLFVFSSCKQNSNKNNTYKKITNACENVVDMEIKGLEIYPRAPDLFKQYKEEKIKLIKKVFDGDNCSEEISNLKEIKSAFNKSTLDADSLSYVERGIETNPYIDLFNSILLREIILSADDNEVIELDKLKCIYLN